MLEWSSIDKKFKRFYYLSNTRFIALLLPLTFTLQNLSHSNTVENTKLPKKHWHILEALTLGKIKLKGEHREDTFLIYYRNWYSYIHSLPKVQAMQKFLDPSNPIFFFFLDVFRKGWAWTSNIFSGINKKGYFLLQPICSSCKTVTNCTPPLKSKCCEYICSFHFIFCLMGDLLRRHLNEVRWWYKLRCPAFWHQL